MQESQESQSSSSVNSFYHQRRQQIEPYCFSTLHILNKDSTGSSSHGSGVSFQAYSDQFFTLESTTATDSATYSSPSSISVSSNRSPFSPPWSRSYASDLHQSCASPLNGFSGVDENKLMHALWALKDELLGPESDISNSGSVASMVAEPSSFTRYDRILEMAPHMDLKQLLIACAETVSEVNTVSVPERKVALSAAESLMDLLEQRVSVSGDPLQKLGAYMLEGLRARLLSSGSIIYKKLRCKEPTSSQYLSSMNVFYQMCPYYKFAYVSGNVIIGEAMENENRIHIIDFQIGLGLQWVTFLKAVSRRPGGPPYIRITGVDDPHSSHARGGGLQLVGQNLRQVAESCGVPFEFHDTTMLGSEIKPENLEIRSGEALAVNFPYILHHIPDESVSTENHRDRLLRLVKSLSPKVVAFVEQESNVNTANFFQRFCETLDYYLAMFESMDATKPREDKQRISAEEHCVAKDLVNIIACEGMERVERHELFGKWRVRLTMAGFSQVPLSPSVGNALRDMLKKHSPNYRLAESNGAVYLGWKNRALATTSAWR